MKNLCKITFIVMLMAVSQLCSANTCPTNCSSCGLKDGSTDSFCFICSSGYKWDQGKCSDKLEDENCTFHSAAGCLGCKEGYYLNMDTQVCDKIANPIQNCIAGGHSSSGKRKIQGPFSYDQLAPEEQKIYQ